MNYKPYSFSKISCYNACPFRFKLKYLDKIKVSPPDPRHFEKGNFYHSTLEHFPEIKKFNFKFADTPKQKLFNETVAEFIENKHVEELLNHKFGAEIEFKFDENLNEFNGTKWKSALYGFIDYIGQCSYEDETLIHIVDWKSKDHGDRFPTDKTQLEMYALWIFTVRPKLQKVICEFAYVENITFTKYEITREYAETIKKNIINNIEVIETDKDFKHNKVPDRNLKRNLLGLSDSIK